MENITLNLTEEECEMVFKGIQSLPFGQVFQLVQKIQKQFEEAHTNIEETHKEKPQVDTTHVKKDK